MARRLEGGSTKGCYVLLWRTRLCTRWRGCSWIRMPRDSRMAVDYTMCPQRMFRCD